MSKNYCLSLDRPVEAEIFKVLDAYKDAYDSHHSKTNQEDYDALSEAGEIPEALRPKREDLDRATIDRALKEGASFTDQTNLIDDSLEYNLHINTPFYQFFDDSNRKSAEAIVQFGYVEANPFRNVGGPVDWQSRKLEIQNEFAAAFSGGGEGVVEFQEIPTGVLETSVNAFELSYNELFDYSSESTPKLNEFLASYLDLSSVCPEDFEGETERLYKQSLLDYFIGKKVIEVADAPGTGAGRMGSITAKQEALSQRGEDALISAYLKRAQAQIFGLEEELENIFAEVKLYQEQCFVLSQLANLIKYKKTSPSLLPRLPYIKQSVPVTMGGGGNTKVATTVAYDANAPILIQDEPFGFMNKMVQYPSTFRLFNLTTAQLSSLVPTIRLYRIETDPATGKDTGSTEIKFDPHPAVKSYQGGKSSLDLFMNKGKRGYGVGLKSFNFIFHGSDPFAVKKAIQADLTLFATSFGDLITQRKGYKFADLALRTGKTPEDLRQNLDIIDQQNLDKLNFRLKAVVGWAIPHKNVNKFNYSEIDAVNNSFVTLNLTPTTHEFNFDEMGGVNFKINYLAYIEDYFNNQTFNIFSDPKLEATREARKLFYEFLGTENCDADSLDAIKAADAKILQNEKARSFSTILKRLRRQEKLLTYNLSYDDVSKFLKGFQIDNEKLVPKAYDATSTDAIQSAFKTFNDATPENERDRVVDLTTEDNSITFFFISDLLSVIMQGIDESLREMNETQKELDFKSMIESQGIYSENDASQVLAKFRFSQQKYKRFLNQRAGKERKQSLLRAKAQFEKLRLVLGPVEIRDPFDSKNVQFCSLGDIPLSLNYFTEFLTKKMIGRDEVYYPLTNFVKDLVSEVIKNFLNNDGCFDFGIRQKLKLNSTTITAYNREENKFHSLNKGYEIAKKEFEYEEGQVRLDDITYFIANNTVSKNQETGKNEPDFGFGNVMDLSRAPIKPLLQISGPDRLPISNPPVEREMNYYIFYAGRAYPTDLMTGNEAVDAANGIFHYVLGKDRGIVKNISLDRTDMKGMKELRFEKEGFDGLTQLREVYNANIDSFLNVQALPGSYIYVDPRGFSPEAGINYSQFGIGGYYMITRAEHSIGVGKADTKIVAKWVADTNGRIRSGENESDKSKVVERNPKSNTTRKCISQYRKSAKAAPRASEEELKKRDKATKRGMGTGPGARVY